MRASGVSGGGANTFSDEKQQQHPNLIVYRKMEKLINQMLSAEEGVPIKTVKSFLSKIPSVFTGQDLVNWLLQNVDIVDLGDALHLAHLLASHGYVFQIDDHILTVKNDGTYYRFQTPYFWPSNCWEPENTEYAVYLCKRTMQNKAHLELEDFEAENLAKLQKMFSRKWEFVFMQAEAQYKVDKKRDRMERQILDSQERAFWDLHRPVPGCVNTTEVDFRKLSRSGRPKYSASTALLAHAEGNGHHESQWNCQSSNNNNNNNGASGPSSSSSTLATPSTSYSIRPGRRRHTQLKDSLKMEITELQGRLAKNVLKTSKVVENYLQYHEHRMLFDAFLVQLGSATDPFQGQPNPWISDTVDFWQHDKITGDISTRRLKLWEESFEELLLDPIGRETLQKFLDKEYSGENLRFWMEVQRLRKCSCRMVPVLVTEIYNEFIDANAQSPVNIDCKVMDITEENLKNNPNRWSFDEAADHIFCLMKNDSYQRFLRSELYRDLVNISKKKSSLSALISRKTSRKVPTSTRIILPPRPNPSSASTSYSSGGHPYPFSLNATASGGPIMKSPHSNSGNELRGSGAAQSGGSRSGSFIGIEREKKGMVGQQQQTNSFDSSTLAGTSETLRRDSACSSPGTTILQQQQPPLGLVGASGTRSSSPSSSQRAPALRFAAREIGRHLASAATTFTAGASLGISKQQQREIASSSHQNLEQPQQQFGGFHFSIGTGGGAQGQQQRMGKKSSSPSVGLPVETPQSTGSPLLSTHSG